MANEKKRIFKETVINSFRNLSFLNGDTFNRQADGELHRRKQNLRKVEKERNDQNKL